MKTYTEKEVQNLRDEITSVNRQNKDLIVINMDLQEQLRLHAVGSRRELLKALIDTNEDVDLLSGHKARLLDYSPETFLVQYNHNEHTDWIKPSEINHKSL